MRSLVEMLSGPPTTSLVRGTTAAIHGGGFPATTVGFWIGPMILQPREEELINGMAASTLTLKETFLKVKTTL